MESLSKADVISWCTRRRAVSVEWAVSVFVEEVVFFEVRTNAVRDHLFKHFRDER